MNNEYAPPADLGRVQKIATGVGLVGVLLWVIGAVISGDANDAKNTFFRSYLVSFVFWTGIGLGCLGFLMIQYLGGAGWGLLIRRQLEAGSHTLWLMFIMFLPIATIGLNSLYGWADPSAITDAAKLELFKHKSLWLNQKWFLI